MIVRAPFTVDQVKSLSDWQNNGRVHPFMCGSHSGLGSVLVPTVRGWICQFCEYTQEWAHDFMLDGTFGL